MSALVSVIVPTCRRPAFLRQALASIRARETQAVKLELLVCDNAPTPETEAVAREFDAKHFSVAAPGAGPARNAGLQAATAPFIAFLDDDDVWLPDHLHAHLALLAENPGLDAAHGQFIYTDPDLAPVAEPRPTKEAAPDELIRNILSGAFLQIGTFVVRAEAARAIGSFDETLIGGQDVDWILRLARRRKLAFTAKPSLLFRGRAPGTFDTLQAERVRYSRRIFLRHALPERRIWSGPRDFVRAYHGIVRHFYDYFLGAARDRLAQGQRWRAARALAINAWNAPLLAAADIAHGNEFARLAAEALFALKPPESASHG